MMEMPIISIIPVPITSVIANTSFGEKSYKDARYSNRTNVRLS